MAKINGILEEGSIEVLIYNGNLDVIVHVPGMNRVVNSLEWKGKEEFNRDGRKKFWTWNDDHRKVVTFITEILVTCCLSI